MILFVNGFHQRLLTLPYNTCMEIYYNMQILGLLREFDALPSIYIYIYIYIYILYTLATIKYYCTIYIITG